MQEQEKIEEKKTPQEPEETNTEETSQDDQKEEKTKEKKKYTLPCRHDRVCFKIFLKQDEIKRSDRETSFNNIFPDRKKREKSQSSIVQISTVCINLAHLYA